MLIALLALIGRTSTGATFTVTTTNDAGVGSLRAAITSANGSAGIDTIAFNIPGAGVRTITLASALPTITERVFIDGYTQPGTSRNSGVWASDAVLRVELNGNNAVTTGLTISATNTRVTGLVMNRFTTSSITINSGANSVNIDGNILGMNAACTASSGTGNGVVVFSANNVIGGNGIGKRNMIAGCTASPAVRISGASATGNQVSANCIGLTAALAPLGGIQTGIRIESGASNSIIGTPDSDLSLVNFIAGCTGKGIVVAGAASTGNDIHPNYLESITGPAIDLGDDGVTANDAGDGDNGANGLQNKVSFSRAMTDERGAIYAEMAFNGTASRTYRVDFYHTSTPNATGAGGATNYLGTLNITTNGSGNWNGHVTIGNWVEVFAGQQFTAIITDNTTRNSSEFAPNFTPTLGRLIVTNTSETVNGNTASVLDLITTPGADGISLREAVLAGNNTSNAWMSDQVFFDLPGGGAQTINLTSPLPTLLDQFAFQGTWDPDYTASPVVRVNGSSAGAGAHGFVSNNGGCAFWGLSITNFSGDGIVLRGASSEIVNCFIGVMPDGVTPAGNGGAGLRIDNSEGNWMGSQWNDHPSLISANALGGVIIDGANAANNVIAHVGIGTDINGLVACGTQPVGITLRNGAHDNTIGAGDLLRSCAISGNTQQGILGTNSHTNSVLNCLIGLNWTGNGALPNGNDGIDLTGNDWAITGCFIGGNGGYGVDGNGDRALILANRIGTNAAGTAAVGNTLGGVRLTGGDDSWVGDGLVTGRNIISGNANDGVLITASTALDVRGNYIGLGADGTTVIANQRDGVRLTGGPTTMVALNTVSGNGGHGVNIKAVDGVILSENMIGTDAAGVLDRGNAGNGVNVENSPNVLIGTGYANRNIIGGNGGHGIHLQFAGTTFPQIYGNHIGLNYQGTAAIANGGDGVHVASGVGAGRIGHQLADYHNIISGNTGNGIFVNGSDGQDIRGNSIGTNAAGTAAVANGQSGIRLENGADGTLIGGDQAGEGNVISGNGDEGIKCLLDNGTIMRGNYIGVNAAGTAAILNYSNGIGLYSSTGAMIGGNTAGARNVISGNSDPAATSDGIYLTGATNNTVQGNYIGTDAAGTAGIPNYSAGIACDANNNKFGGTGAGEGNLIAYNGAFGIRIGSGYTGNCIQRNAIHSNAGLGIDLNSDGVTANDAGDGDTGANSLLNFPQLVSASLAGGTTTITGTLNSAASTSYTVEYFASATADAGGYGEGQRYLGSSSVTTNTSGNATLSFNATGVAAGEYITATTTNGSGTNPNTSEFSNAIMVTSGYTVAGTVFEDVNYGGGAGRDRGTALAAGGTRRPGARVELYDGSGNFLTSTTTNAVGQYGFTPVAPGTYTIRVVNSTVSSARTGYVAGTHLAVQTFRMENGALVTDRVGGEVPNKVDAGNGSTTLAALTTATQTAQSIATVVVASADRDGYDFGFSFNVVCNTNDAGQGSLRQFITQANALSNTGMAQQGRPAGFDNAVFMISNGMATAGLRAGNNYFTSGVATITPTSALPVITSPVVIDAQTQPGFTASPVIEIRGTSAGDNPCFNVNGTGGGSIFRGLIVNRFNREGIYTIGNNVVLQGNWFGLDRTGTLDQGNGINGWSAGISLDSDGNTVGGTTATQRNVISGDNAYGIWLGGDNNTISGNYIGLNAAGTAAVPNSFQGIIISNASNNTIGGTAAGAGNVISGNGNDGIIFNGISTGNALVGNIIGLNAAGTAAVPNGDDGVDIESDGNTIGNGTPAGRNIISGNADDGIILDGPDNCVIRGNYVGTNAAGTAAVPNGGDGLQLSNGAATHTIGGAAPGQGNLISGNGADGIRMSGAGTTGNLVQGNHIGLNSLGAALGNTAAGISISAQAATNTIGGTATGARNVISANGGHGILVDNASGQIILNNHIGTNVAGSSAGSTDANAAGGITVQNGANNTLIGDGTAAGRNVLGRSGADAIVLGAGTSGAVVRGNYIGVGSTGCDVQVSTVGIRIVNSSNNTIGGPAAGDRNVTGGVVGHGVLLDGVSSTGNTVRNNSIGYCSDGITARGIGGDGIRFVNGASNNLIGGVGATDGNLIGNCNGTGIILSSATCQGNRLLGNSIHNSGLLGIDLGSTGVTLNDAMDVDNGSNGLQNFPVLSSANSTGGSTVITGTFNSTAGTTFRIEFYSAPVIDPWGHGEGLAYLGFTNVTTDASGNAAINVTFPISLTAGHVVSSTATHSTLNNTSEFSGSIAVTSGYTVAGTAFEDVNYGGGAGRDRGTALAAGGTRRPGARVELYDGSGNFLSATTTNAVGQYSFTSVAPGTYTVRVVNSSVSSARSGYVAGSHLAVQTFRTDASTGTAMAVTDHVGGEVPDKVDAGNGSSTLAALNTATTAAQSTAAVTVGSADISGLDFGYSFNVVCNTNNAGQGSLRQFITHANALSNTGLAIQGRMAGIDHAVFMIGNGTAAAGLRATNNYFVAGVAPLVPTATYPALSSAVVIDGQTQPGWTGSPLIDIAGAGAGAGSNGFSITSAGTTLRGMIIRGFSGSGIRITGAASDNARIQGCWIGTDITGSAANGNTKGITISGGSTGHLLGGSALNEGNVISGNTGLGVQLSGAGTVRVQGNRIGTDPAGISAVPNGSHGIESNGTTLVAGTDGDGSNDATEGNLISGNAIGIYLNGASNTVIAGNRIGVDITGANAIPNTSDGIWADGGSNGVRVGTNSDGISDTIETNLISGNVGNGLEFRSAAYGIVAGNVIGLAATGATALPNMGCGVFMINGPHHIRIGTNGDGVNDLAERNLIAGNAQHGIYMHNTSHHNTVAGNHIGTDASGTLPLGNGGSGAYVHSRACVANTIGGTSAVSGNLIVSNGVYGVFAGGDSTLVRNNRIGLRSTGTAAPNNIGLQAFGPMTGLVVRDNIISGNTGTGVELNSCQEVSVENNLIGTDPSGTAARANGGHGVIVYGSDITATGNTISANGLNGIHVQGNVTAFTLIGNRIGTSADGLSPLGNSGDGVRIQSAVPGAMIRNNIISANGGGGLAASTSSGTITGMVISSNLIGTDQTGSVDLGNGGHGISLDKSDGTVIGTDANGTGDDQEGNVISGNAGSGILLGAAATQVIVAGNQMGTAMDGIAGLSNAAHGIEIRGANNVIGGTTPAQRNVISGNTLSGAFLSGVQATGNQVLGNRIGTNAFGTAAIANGIGVRIDSSASSNVVGGAAAGAGNTIAGNTTDGVFIGGAGTTNNTVQGNHVGTDPTGTLVLGNGQEGVDLGASASGNLVGGTGAGEGNLVRNNGGSGFYSGVTVENGSGNRILGNRIDVNSGLGIQLRYFSTVPLPNDVGDGDTGANGRQNFPVLTTANVSGTNTTVTGTLNSTASSTFRIEFFSSPTADPSDHGEGMNYLGFQNVTTDASGNAVISATLAGAVTLGHSVSSTATNTITNNTSEFSGRVLADAPPIAVCQPVTIQLNAAGNASITAAMIDNGSYDTDGTIASLTASPNAFTCANVGANTVTLTVTDNLGATATCNATVTVVDATAPTIIACPANITVNAGATCTATATWTPPTVSDNCAGATITQSSGPGSGSTFPIGTTNISYIATDAAGNNATCSFTVTVVDATAPTIIACPANITVNAGAACTATATWTAPTVSDNCAGATITQSSGAGSGSTFPIGTTDISYIATDAAGNNATCSFTVTVVDATAPTIICPADITVGNDAGICGALVNYIAPVGADNCGGATTTLTSGPPSGSVFPVGTTTVTYQVTDAAGLIASCSFTATVNDTEAPVAVCQNLTVNIGTSTITASTVNNGSTDNCTISSMSVSPNGPFNTVGVFPVTLTVTDAAGNSDDCAATVTVSDSNPPVAVCQDVTIHLNAFGVAGILPTDIDGGSTDNGSIASLVTSQTAFDCSDLGANNVTLTVTDDGGNSASCVAVVTVLDTIAPTAVCQNITAYLDASGNVTITGADLNGGSSDNCGTGSLTFGASTASFDCSDLGPQTVTLTVTDASGNSSACSASVTVQDTITPTLACAPATINIDGNGWAVFTASALATWSDNCSSGISTWTSSDSVEVVGDTTITVYVQDASGNIDSCSTTLTVSDSNPPAAVCQPVTIYLDASGNASIAPEDINGGSTDNGTIVSMIASQTAFDCSDLGANNVTLTVTDDGGNSASCVAVVTVLDTIAPTAVCQNITAYLDASGNVTITGADLNGGSSDNCGTGSLTFGASTASFDCSDLGPQTVTLTVTDASGNSSACSASVTVQDTITPTLACAPATINIDGNGWAVFTASALATWSDNCSSGISTWTSSDSVQVVGDTTITVYVQDASGNIDSCSTTLTVSDSNPPVAVCQPVTIYLDASGSASIVAADINGGSTDNGTIVSMIASQTAFDCSDLGANNVTLTVTDDGGNSASCVAVVTVLDTIAPTAVCLNITAYLDASGNVTITGADLNGGSSDNCGTSSLTFGASTASFDCSDLGPQTVTLTVNDASGNSSACSASVTVQDTITPTLACAPATINIDGNGWAVFTASALATWSDNCSSGISTWTSSDSVQVVGDTTITVYVQDASGNIDSCSTTLTVSDSNPPVAVCQPVTIYLDASGNASIVPEDINGGSTDNGTIVSMIASQTAFHCSDLGANNVTLTVTDDGGNSASCVAVVTVLDTIAPTVFCHDATVYLNVDGEAMIAVADLLQAAQDNCGVVSATAEVDHFTAAGTQSVQVSVTDASGNTSVCSATVSVLDTILPQAMCLAFGGITVHLDSTGIAVVDPIQLDGGSWDNDSIIAFAASQTVFDCSDLGNNATTLYITDAAGNVDSCVTVVTVLDTIAPMAACQAITVELDADGTALITGISMDAGSIDQCGIAGYMLSDSVFQQTGTWTVELTVIDISGNSSTCTSTVTVVDPAAPQAVCQPVMIYLDEAGSASIEPGDIDGGSLDNAGITAMTASQTVFGCDHIGPNNVILTVTDEGGNSDSCVAVVTVLDTIAPTVLCQSITLELDSDGHAVITAAELDGGSIDNCGVMTFTADQTSFSTAGVHTVTLTVTDASGNSSSCTTTVTIEDNDAPTAICRPQTIYLDEAGIAWIDAADIDGGSLDNGVIVDIAASQVTFGCDDLGPNDVVLTVTDEEGNSAICVAVVTVLDTIDPIVSCRDITMFLDANGQAVILADSLDGGSTDNCGIGSMEVSIGLVHDAGTYQVELTVVDASGNSSTCVATVTVAEQQDEDPVNIPSGFSPNGDGTADTWILTGIAEGSTVEVVVFDRWGDAVYESADYRGDWDGNCTRGFGAYGPLPDGTYFYVMTIHGGDDVPRNGYLQIAH